MWASDGVSDGERHISEQAAMVVVAPGHVGTQLDATCGVFGTAFPRFTLPSRFDFTFFNAEQKRSRVQKLSQQRGRTEG